MLRPRPLLCLLALLALALGGCSGASGDRTTTETTANAPKQAKPKADVTPAQVERSDPGSPERVVLEWWRDIQLNDPEHAQRLYLEPPRLADLAGQFNVVAGRLAGAAEVVSSQEEDGAAAVEVRWSRPAEGPRVVSLQLEERGGKWKLLGPRFVNEMVARVQAAEEKD
jgi:hypothetical protein